MTINTDDILLLIHEVLASKRTNALAFESLSTTEVDDLAAVDPEIANTSDLLIELDTNLETVGIDSLGFIQLIVLIEENYNLEIPDENLLFSELNTIKKIQALLESILESNVDE